MGSNTIGAVGVSLPPPQALYPAQINNQPQISATNRISLPPGGNILIPSGTWWVVPGVYSSVQVLDPVTNTWVVYETDTINTGFKVNSDGVNYRIINPTGFPIGACVTNGGTGYTSAPAVAAGAGGSTWLAIVGGAISQINISAAGSGLNYGSTPIVNIAAPPSPGVPATAAATINSAGAITTITMINQGAGYTSAPAVTISPAAGDPNLLSTSTVNITNAKATAQLSYVGVVSAVLLTNDGLSAQAQAPALTFSGGAGSNAAATAVMALTVTGYTVTTAGSGYAQGAVSVSTFGGSLATLTSGLLSSPSSPVMAYGLMVPRQAQITAWVSATIGGVVLTPFPNGGVIDGGLFEQVPFVTTTPAPSAATSGGASPNVIATLGLTMGSVNDTVFVTPL